MTGVDNFRPWFFRASTVRHVRSRLASALAAVLVTGALIVGCTPTPEPTPTPTGFATDEEAFAAAEATYRAYVDALNRVDLSDPETFGDVYAWTTGEANTNDRKTFSQMHADSLTVSGESVVAVIQPLGEFEPDAEALQLGVCLDVSTINLVNTQGESVVSPDRGDQQSMLITLVPSDTPTRLIISQFDGRDGEPKCTGG